MRIDKHHILLGSDEEVVISKHFGPERFSTHVTVKACRDLGSPWTDPGKPRPGWMILKTYMEEEGPRKELRPVQRLVDVIPGEEERRLGK